MPGLGSREVEGGRMQAARSLAVAAAAGIVAAAAFAAPTTAAGTPSPPSVGSLSPHSGSTAGGVRVTVLGTGFR
ncbi:MAG TPA: IPT/TIG domain-containing protein, partial [Mycobacterium sp.]|nr:IPT/TIG domain-containing protein [Mycobacterium sp.]